MNYDVGGSCGGRRSSVEGRCSVFGVRWQESVKMSAFVI